MSSVPGVAITEHTAQPRLGRPRWSMTAETDGRVLDLPSLDQTIQRAVAGTVVRDVKTQPINQGGGGQMPAKRPHGRAALVRGPDAPDRHAFFEGGKRADGGDAICQALQIMERVD